MKSFAEGKGDITGIQSCRSHLVKKGLKLVVIEFVQEEYLKSGLIIQFACQPQPGKACTYNDNLYRHTYCFTNLLFAGQLKRPVPLLIQ